jgi:hypothetical protein
VKGEISSFLKMLGEVYQVFGLDYSLALSTRPEGYLGEIELWNQAEAALKESLNDSGALLAMVGRALRSDSPDHSRPRAASCMVSGWQFCSQNQTSAPAFMYRVGNLVKCLTKLARVTVQNSEFGETLEKANRFAHQRCVKWCKFRLTLPCRRAPIW